MSHRFRTATIPSLILAATSLLAISQACAQSTAPTTPVTTQALPVTDEFILLIDARYTMAMNTTSKPPHGRLHMAVAAANSAVDAIPAGTNLGILVLQNDIRTLRSVSPLQAKDRQSIKLALSKLTPTGNALLHRAFEHLREKVLKPRNQTNVFLLVMSDGTDASPKLTLSEAGPLHHREGSTRSLMLTTLDHAQGLGNLQKIAQAIHPQDNAHQILKPDDLPTALASFELACDAVEANRSYCQMLCLSGLRWRRLWVVGV
jgi:hypothetical protein